MGSLTGQCSMSQPPGLVGGGFFRGLSMMGEQVLNFTLAQIRTKVQNDLDLLDEDFITVAELDAYINEGIDVAEAEIHTIYEMKNQHYFLSVANISLVTGTSYYASPADIYANKIRRLIYDDGSRKYKLRVIKNLDEIPLVESTEDY